MGRSSRTDSRSEDEVLGLWGADTDLRRCGIRLRGRRLLATLLAMAAMSCGRSVASRIGRGTLACLRC